MFSLSGQRYISSCFVVLLQDRRGSGAQIIIRETVYSMMLLIVGNALSPYQPNLWGTLSSSSWSVLSSGASPSSISDNLHPASFLRYAPTQHIMLHRSLSIQHSMWNVKDRSFSKNIKFSKVPKVSCPTVFLNKQESTSLLRRQSSEFPILKGRTKHFGNFQIK